MSHSDRPEPDPDAVHPALARRVGRTRAATWSGSLPAGGGPAPSSEPEPLHAAAPDAGCEPPTGREPLSETGPITETGPLEETGPITGTGPLTSPGSLIETGPLDGLGESDLGMVPVPATPPNPAHRGAWFAVAASGAVLGGLLLVTAALVHPPRSAEGTDPVGIPRGQDRTPPDARAFDPPALPRALPVVRSAPGPEAVPVLGPPVLQPPPSTAAETVQSAPAGGEAPPVAESPLPEPTFRAELVRFADPELVAARSGAYFDAIRAGDLRGAYAMTTGDLRKGGYEAFAAPYADARRIEIRGVHAASTGTETDLRITGADGDVLDQRRQLRFTAGSDPRMYADGPAG